MAKQLVNPLERHVEKAVLGVAGLLLIAVVARYVIVSPNRLSIGGDSVTPAHLDAEVARKAEEMRRRIQAASDDVELPQPLYDEFVASLDPRLTETLPGVLPFGPPVPIIDPPDTVAGATDLVRVAPFAAGPGATRGRSTLLDQNPDGSPWFRAANWVTVSAVFDVKAQMAEQQTRYGATRRKVIFGPAELQRRKQRPDGTWPDAWEDVEPWPALRLPSPPRIRIVEEGDHLLVPREDRQELDRFVEKLAESRTQLDILRPMMAEMVPGRGDPWTFPVLTSYRDVLKQDDELMYPTEPPAELPADRYKGELEPTRAAAEPEEKTPSDLLAEARKLLEEARKTDTEALARRAYNRAFDVENSPRASGSEKSEARRLRNQANQLEALIQRRKVLGGKPQAPTGSTASDEEGRPRRTPLPAQQIWAHDAMPNRVESGARYQYRIRATVFNRLAGEPALFRDPDDALQLFIAGEWSDPAEVSISPAVEFFVTSETRRNNEVGVEFFKWDSGVWIKSRRFRFTVGDRLEGEDRVAVPDLADPTVPVTVPIQFSAGTQDGEASSSSAPLIIDVDFGRPYAERRSIRAGVRFGTVGEGVCMVYVDVEGRLYERFLDIDKSHPGLRDARARLWTPRR